MADIELVVKIPEDYYKVIKEIPVEQSTADMLIIRFGTPLPKGHGRLIDADELRCEREDFDTYFDYSNAFDVIYNAPTIIAADTEREGY